MGLKNKTIKNSTNKFVSTSRFISGGELGSTGKFVPARRKLVYEALKSLPDKFVDDKTNHCSFNDTVVVTNPKYAPIVYKAKAKKWGKVKFIETRRG